MVDLGSRITLEEAIKVHNIFICKLIQALLFCDLGVSEKSGHSVFVTILPFGPKAIVMAFERHCKARYEIWLLEELVALLLKFMPTLNERPNVIDKDLHEVLLIKDAIFVIKLGWQRSHSESGSHILLSV